MRDLTRRGAVFLLVLFAACGDGTDDTGGAAAGNGPGDAAAPVDTGLNPTVTVDTQPLPGDTGQAPR